MNNIREILENREETLHKRAARSRDSVRVKTENPSEVRTEFQRDRDRIIHSKSFRRLKHKTQVFISPEGDHYRTRLTHTLEVSQIARTIARALVLNEDLAEAIALGHDLGHTPFGHTGERVLDEISAEGFKHYEQSLRVVDKLENSGRGLNLSVQVRDGIVKHSKGKGPVVPEELKYMPATLEGQIVRISDIVAYVNHDLDDSVRGRIISDQDIPGFVKKTLGETFSQRIDTIVKDIIRDTIDNGYEKISMSDPVMKTIVELREFLFANVYRSSALEDERSKAEEMLRTVYEYVMNKDTLSVNDFPLNDPLQRRVLDFIAGMTDNFAIGMHAMIVSG